MHGPRFEMLHPSEQEQKWKNHKKDKEQISERIVERHHHRLSLEFPVDYSHCSLLCLCRINANTWKHKSQVVICLLEINISWCNMLNKMPMIYLGMA